MSICTVCMVETYDGGDMCRYHGDGDPRWALVNRVWCDFVHRRVEPPNLDHLFPDDVMQPIVMDGP